MSNYMTVDEILSHANEEHITADQLDILITKTKELSILRQRELNELEKVLTSLENRLQQS